MPVRPSHRPAPAPGAGLCDTLRAPADRAQHARLGVLAVHALARGPSLSALSAPAGARVPRAIRRERSRVRAAPSSRIARSAGERRRCACSRRRARLGPGGDEVARCGRARTRARPPTSAIDGGDQRDRRERPGEPDAVGVIERHARRRGEGVRDPRDFAGLQQRAELAMGGADDLAGVPAGVQRARSCAR